MVYMGVALAALLLLAAGLARLQFSAGVPFSLGGNLPAPPGESQLPSGGDFVSLFLRSALALFIVLLAAYLLVNLFSPAGRKRLLSDVILLILAFLVLNLIPHSSATTPSTSSPAPAGAPAALVPTAPVATFTANPPAWADLVAIGVAAVILTALLFILARYAGRRKRPSRGSLERIAQQAEATLDALRLGGDFKNAVLRCYFEMGQALERERQIKRERSMTPAEFEALLVGQGLPETPVRQLTSLFEEARYGDRAPDEQDEQRAIASLTAILAACRGAS